MEQRKPYREAHLKRFLRNSETLAELLCRVRGQTNMMGGLIVFPGGNLRWK